MRPSARRTLVLLSVLAALLAGATGSDRAPVEGAPAPGRAAADASAVDATRTGLLRLLDWPGSVRLRLENAEILSGGERFQLEVTAEKSQAGLLLQATLAAPDGRPVFQARAQARRDGADTVALSVDLTGEPQRLGALWPAGLPTPRTAVSHTDVRLRAGGVVGQEGRLALGWPEGPPLTLDFVARYEAARAELTVSRYVVASGDDLRLEGEARAELRQDGTRVSASARGDVDGSRLEARARGALASGAYDGVVTLAPFDVRRLAQRLGTAAPAGLAGQRLTVRLAGTATAAETAVDVDARADGLGSGVISPSLEAGLRASLAFTRTADGLSLGAIDAARLTLGDRERPVLALDGRSRAGGAWPLDVTGGIGDLALLAPFLPFAATLSGSASVTAEVQRPAPLALTGRIEVALPRAEVAFGGGMTVSQARVAIPLGWGVAAPTGTLAIERVAGLNFALEDLRGTTAFADGRLLLPDLGYVHYGGRGGGWLELAVDGRVMPFRSRLEGGGVDLERLVSAWGKDVARVTGTLRYVATAVYTTPQGFLGGIQVESEEGGEIAIDAIQRLLDSSAVKVDSTGMLQQTLESLRVFRYESLEGDLWLGQDTDRINLSLRGRKRLGIFPAPIEAINFRNVPLSVLTRTLRKGESR